MDELDVEFDEAFQERAAIREFDGKQTREEAEEQAHIEVKAAGGVKKK